MQNGIELDQNTDSNKIQVPIRKGGKKLHVYERGTIVVELGLCMCTFQIIFSLNIFFPFIHLHFFPCACVAVISLTKICDKDIYIRLPGIAL